MASYNFNAPKITFAQAMRLSLSINVKDCSADVFQALMHQAAQRASNPEKAFQALKGMDFSNTVDRWYSLNSLREMGVPLPIGEQS